MKRGFQIIFFINFISGLLLSTTVPSASANPRAISPEEIQKRIEQQSRFEIRREMQRQRFPNFIAYVEQINFKKRSVPVHPTHKKWISVNKAFHPTIEDWNLFFKFAIKDQMTTLRAFAILANRLKFEQVAVVGSGVDFKTAMEKNHIDLGLSLPFENIVGAIWSPDPSNDDPDFLVHTYFFYEQPYLHRFDDDVLPVDLKVGVGQKGSLTLDHKKYDLPMVEADLFYSDTEGTGFRNVRGIQGTRRGILGFFQSILFFLPNGLSAMYIDPEGKMITEAIMNTEVAQFEKNKKYAISIKNQSHGS
ncbi:MAG: hypothetical protein CL678_09160 [Bdellovibrionaceae bacterium]|nr:hypothetical protein [Pseudobdellovibrionaceae bacterium]